MRVPASIALDLLGNVATEVWNYPANQNIHCPFCSSIYEDQPFNYLIDYAFVNGGGPPNIPTFAQFTGLGCCRRKDFLLSISNPRL